MSGLKDRKKASIDDYKIEDLDDISKFFEVVKKTATLDVEKLPLTDVEVMNMKANIPVVMAKHAKIILKIDDKIIDFEDEYEEMYYSLYQQYKKGELRGEKLGRFFEDREIKMLIPMERESRLLNIKIKKLKSLKKFEEHTLDQLRTKSYALNDFKALGTANLYE